METSRPRTILGKEQMASELKHVAGTSSLVHMPAVSRSIGISAPEAFSVFSSASQPGSSTLSLDAPSKASTTTATQASSLLVTVGNHEVEVTPAPPALPEYPFYLANTVMNLSCQVNELESTVCTALAAAGVDFDYNPVSWRAHGYKFGPGNNVHFLVNTFSYRSESSKEDSFIVEFQKQDGSSTLLRSIFSDFSRSISQKGFAGVLPSCLSPQICGHAIPTCAPVPTQLSSDLPPPTFTGLQAPTRPSLSRSLERQESSSTSLSLALAEASEVARIAATSSPQSPPSPSPLELSGVSKALASLELAHPPTSLSDTPITAEPSPSDSYYVPSDLLDVLDRVAAFLVSDFLDASTQAAVSLHALSAAPGFTATFAPALLAATSFVAASDNQSGSTTVNQHTRVLSLVEKIICCIAGTRGPKSSHSILTCAARSECIAMRTHCALSLQTLSEEPSAARALARFVSIDHLLAPIITLWNAKSSHARGPFAADTAALWRSIFSTIKNIISSSDDKQKAVAKANVPMLREILSTLPTADVADDIRAIIQMLA